MGAPSGTYWEQFDDLVARVYRRPSETDGLSRATVAHAESRLGCRIPDRLRELYLHCGQREDLLRSHERLLAPDELRLEDGVLVFVEENQGLSEWGVRAGSADPHVERKDFTRDPSWEPDHDHLSDFLMTFVFWQAVNGGAPAGGVATADDRVFQELSAWREVKIAGSHWTQTRFYSAKNQLLCLVGTEDVSVLAAARDVESFAALDGCLEVTWDYTWPHESG
jgi:hypothetical protein